MPTAENRIRNFQVTSDQSGLRLDQLLSQLFPDHSRARVTEWIRAGDARLDGERVKPSRKVRSGEALAVIEPALEEVTFDAPQDMALEVIHADEHIIVVNKRAGLVVHPAAGHRDGTLVNGLLHRFPDLSGLPRAGIVHRLDKLTSGVMVVARSAIGHTALTRQLKERTMGREYCAVVFGEPVSGGTVDAPIGRHPVDRKRMAVRDGAKPAVTHYRIEQRWRGATSLLCTLETGRTHQIRVHMSHINLPIVGDPVYGGRRKHLPNAVPEVNEMLAAIDRQMLHAQRLTLANPASGNIETFEAPLPEDMAGLITMLEDNS